MREHADLIRPIVIPHCFPFRFADDAVLA